jgi:hypothetical protein
MTPYAKLVESLAHSGITDFLEINRIAAERNVEIDEFLEVTDTEVTPETKE